MKITLISAALLFPALLHAGDPVALFNGKDLTGWEGLPAHWSVQDGAITGSTTAENPAKGNNFLIWKDGTVGDFELTLKYKFTEDAAQPYGNSGVQYRSKLIDKDAFVVGGYQGDFEVGKTYSGILYEERGRGILAQRGQKVTIKQGSEPGKPVLEVTGETGKSDDIQAAIKQGDWNEYRIVATGNHVQHYINGKLSIDVTDETAEAPKDGILALQVHAGPPMKIQFKDIMLKR